MHAEDVLDESIHVDLDQTFVRRNNSSKKARAKDGSHSMGSHSGSHSRGSSMSKGGSVLAMASGGSVLGAAGVARAPSPPTVVFAERPITPKDDNPFNSRMFGGAGGFSAAATRQGGIANVRATRLQNSEKPTLHQSKPMLRD